MEQKPIEYEELFGFGVAVEPDEKRNLHFRDRDDRGDKLWGHLRARGYAAALVGGFVGRVRIFCPTIEFKPMRDNMIEHGAGPGLIEHHDTLATTWDNGRVMHAVLAERDFDRNQVCGCSSGYHDRAQFFGNQLHDFRITFVPAEAFIFAATTSEAEESLVFAELMAEFGDSELTRRQLRDWQGIGARLAGRYKIPLQPKE